MIAPAPLSPRRSRLLARFPPPLSRQIPPNHSASGHIPPDSWDSDPSESPTVEYAASARPASALQMHLAIISPATRSSAVRKSMLHHPDLPRWPRQIGRSQSEIF